MIEVLCKESSLLITYLFAFLLQSETLALKESMKQELEEKIRKLEEDKQNMDISAGNVIHNVWRIAHVSLMIRVVLKYQHAHFLLVNHCLDSLE